MKQTNLYKKLLLSVTASALMATSGLALDTSKIYGIGGLALESVDGLDAGFAIILGAGLPVLKAGPGTVAAEAELTYSLVSPSIGGYDMTVTSLGAYSAYKFDINEQYFVKPRVGLVYKSASVSYGSASASDSEIGLAFGVQGGYVLNKSMDIVVGYNLLDGTDITHLSAGVNYRF